MRAPIVALGSIGALYLIVLLALYFLQRSMIYPAPREIAALPSGFEQASLRTEDGLRLKAAYRPAREGMPTAVFFHGNGDSWDGASAATAVLAQAGYGVLLPEYRGYGGNPGSPSEEGLYADGRAAVDFLAQRGIEGNRLILIGNSLGSGVATQLALERNPRALVLVSAYTSLPDVAAEKFPWLPTRLLIRDRFDNRAKLGRIEAPVLVLHGEADNVVPFAHGRPLAEVARNGSFASFRRAGHELAYTEEGQVAVRDWLAGR